MIVGIPKEIKDNEKRVSLTPFGVSELVKNGHKVLVETQAGVGSGFYDSIYEDSGARIIEKPTEIFALSEMIIKVKEPQPAEVKMIKKDQIVFTFFHFAADSKLTTGIINSQCSAISYETVQNDDKSLPILIPMSEVAGRMAVQNGAKCLEGNMGGKGKLLGGVPGVDAATVTVLGGGIVGSNAAKLAAGLGAKVYILDIDMARLRYLDDVMPSNVQTMYSNHQNIENLLSYTDLLIGSVLVVGSKAPNLVSKSMLKKMSPGSVIVDVAVDQGGCVETCTPTTHKNPTFVIDDIVHYCVSNMPGSVPYTSTLALTNVTLPYCIQLANSGIPGIKSHKPLLSGLNIHNGNVCHAGVAKAFDLPYVDVYSLLQ
jgi:alanine dehydrogenase